jgi:hypothetical protein
MDTMKQNGIRIVIVVVNATKMSKQSFIIPLLPLFYPLSSLSPFSPLLGLVMFLARLWLYKSLLRNPSLLVIIGLSLFRLRVHQSGRGSGVELVRELRKSWQ